jgi:hypothetical protein
MSDHQFDPPPDLQLIADLIDDSSLGALDAFEAQNEVPTDIAMRLRNRIRQDVPDRQWDSLPESTAVLRHIATVFPDANGSFVLPKPPSPGQAILAVSRSRQTLELDLSAPVLPGGADRQHWEIYVPATKDACRCQLEVPIEAYASSLWTIEVAIWWQLTEPVKAASTGQFKLTNDLITRVVDRLGYVKPRVPDTVGKQILFEYAFSQMLLERGITAECAVRIRSSDHPVSDAQVTVDPLTPSLHASTTNPFTSSRRASSITTHVVNGMAELHSEGRTSASEEYMSLLRDRFRASLKSFAYALSLLDEALRVMGVQVDEARSVVRHVVDAVSPAEAGLIERRLTADPLDAAALLSLVGSVLGFRSLADEPRGSIPLINSGLIIVDDDDLLDFEARRQARYEFDDLLT